VISDLENNGKLRKIALGLFWLLAILVYQFTKLVVSLDRKFKFKLPFPGRIEDLEENQEWCIETLTRAGALPKGIDVTSFTITQPNPDLIFRSDTALCIIEYVLEGRTSTLKFVAKFSPSHGPVSDRVTYNLQQNHVKEVNFNNEFAPQLRLDLTPKVFFAELHEATGNMCILMEYMKDYKEFNEFEGCPENLLPLVVKNLAELHATFWNVKDKEVKGITAIPRVVADFFESYHWFKWSRPAINVFRQTWERVNVDQTVIHGDPRVGNIMFHKQREDAMVFIDWQGARMSKAAFDVAYFLVLSVAIDTRIKYEDDLLQTYYESLVEVGIKDYTLEDIRDDYNYSSLLLLTMLATPGLTAEGSFERGSDSSMTFLLGYKYWYDRIESKVTSLDHWVAEHFEMDAVESKRVISEILSSYRSYLANLQAKICPDPVEADKKFAQIEEKISNMRE